MNCSCGHPIQEHGASGCQVKNSADRRFCQCMIPESDFVDGLETRLEQAEALWREYMESHYCPFCNAEEGHAADCKLAAWLGV